MPPIYRQLAQRLTDRIRQGLYRPGEKLPTLRQLSLELQASPNATQRAIEFLTSQGLLESQQGLGIWVRPQGPTPDELSLGLLLSSFAPLNSGLLGDLDTLCETQAAHFFLKASQHDPAQEQRLLQRWLARPVPPAGLLIQPVDPHSASLKALAARLPVLLLAEQGPPECRLLDWDWARLAREMLDHLVTLGFEQVRVVLPPSSGTLWETLRRRAMELGMEHRLEKMTSQAFMALPLGELRADSGWILLDPDLPVNSCLDPFGVTVLVHGPSDSKAMAWLLDREQWLISALEMLLDWVLGRRHLPAKTLLTIRPLQEPGLRPTAFKTAWPTPEGPRKMS